MIIGFALKKAQSLEELCCLSALGEAQCQRIVLAHPTQGQDLLAAVLRLLKSGDTLVVESLSAVAETAEDLVEFALKLEVRGIQLKSLEEEFDTHSREKVTETLARLSGLGKV